MTLEDRCVVCGEIVPEGKQVCNKCLDGYCSALQKGGYLNDSRSLANTTRNQEIKADDGKPQLRLVPTEIINCIAKVREFGNKKYKDSNSWKRVEKYRYIDAMFRHLLKYINDNKSVDSESGLPHLWHLACNVAFLCEMEKDKE